MFGACDLKGNDVERFGAKIVLKDRRYPPLKRGNWKLILVKKRFACARPPVQTRSTRSTKREDLPTLESSKELFLWYQLAGQEFSQLGKIQNVKTEDVTSGRECPRFEKKEKR